MKLTVDEIRAITSGAVSVEETEAGIRFYRFTKEQLEIYPKRREALVLKSLAATGVKFCFETDSENLYVRGLFEHASARSYFSLDVAVNGKVIGSMDNFSHMEIPAIYTDIAFEMGRYEKNFSLGKGMKSVTVYLPWNKIVTLEDFSLDDGSVIKPIRFAKKLLAFGDSITQGFDAMRNTSRQMGRMAERLNAEEVSKAVGAETFDPELAALRDDFEPDYIFVAYGTNDFTGKTPEKFTADCNGFFAEIYKNYPDAKIFAITPIWRADMENPRAFTSFFDIEKGVRSAAEKLPNVMVIDGQTLVPHDTKYFADGRLHPNDEGFDHYFNNLWEAVKDHV
ncbi:MAG: SGNH/GDSL hydrolase family protein [Oscillospiraceae bacterium]|nr:SGNH/GDSL hydrolase family protein [Oscillospiraceae bacterium]